MNEIIIGLFYNLNSMAKSILAFSGLALYPVNFIHKLSVSNFSHAIREICA